MFILLLQTIWLFISELAGKDLDFSVIVKFLTFAIPRLIPMVLPLTILLTSIMIFGKFAENYEFAAMKSSGISLQRAMRLLFVFIALIGIGAFFFSNTVIPLSEKRFVNLRKNIVKLKPAMAVTPNQFNDLGDKFNMKISEKYGDNDRYLKDIIIHQRGQRAGNHTVIKSKEGEFKGGINSDLITLVLKDGYYYDEIQQNTSKRRKKHPFAKVHFSEYLLNIDLSELEEVDMDAQRYSKGYNMLNVVELQNEIDTLGYKIDHTLKEIENDIGRRHGFTDLNKNMKKDSIHIKAKILDTLDILNILSPKQLYRIYGVSYSNVDRMERRLASTIKNTKIKKRALNKYTMSLHNKYVLGISCILLFFVGAPLGAIIRKGGVGLPMVVGVFLFLTYHFIGIFAKNSAEEGGISPFFGSWISTFIIFPLSIFLTYRATTDQGLLNIYPIIHPFRKLFTRIMKPKS